MGGHAIPFGPYHCIIHGGSGWIMSRAAAQLYYVQQAEIDLWFRNLTLGDDSMPTYFRTIAGWPFEKLLIPGFIGPPVTHESHARLREANYSGLLPCPG
jgi:hypothetical protein